MVFCLTRNCLLANWSILAQIPWQSVYLCVSPYSPLAKQILASGKIFFQSRHESFCCSAGNLNVKLSWIGLCCKKKCVKGKLSLNPEECCKLNYPALKQPRNSQVRTSAIPSTMYPSIGRFFRVLMIKMDATRACNVLYSIIRGTIISR